MILGIGAYRRMYASIRLCKGSIRAFCLDSIPSTMATSMVPDFPYIILTVHKDRTVHLFIKMTFRGAICIIAIGMLSILAMLGQTTQAFLLPVSLSPSRISRMVRACMLPYYYFFSTISHLIYYHQSLPLAYIGTEPPPAAGTFTSVATRTETKQQCIVDGQEK